MNANSDLALFKRYFWVSIGLALILIFPGEPVLAALPQATSISIQMSNPTCVQALPARGTCSIQMNSLVANGSDPSFSRLEILVNGKLRLFMSGFFESTAYFSHPMLPDGLKVACGGPNAGGLPNYGKSYLIAANAYMADGISATNSLVVYCPAYDGKTYLPAVHK